jgi:hypothetical protein
MVFWRRCSSTNFLASSISSYVRGSSCPGNILGAPGRSSIAWFQIVCLGSLCNSCSENILLCHWYSVRIFSFGSVLVIVIPTITFSMKY